MSDNTAVDGDVTCVTQELGEAVCADSSPLPRRERHDLRSSVGQIIGYAELWIDELETGGAPLDKAALRNDMERIQTAGRRILEIVNTCIDPVGPRARAEMGET
ncbi:MAG TPA: hypothetical protein VKT77_13645 [Chthonomonadaceae bacterium]|nr:hypothetical protein [Chthonomonadaceae bacterium]